MKKYVLVGEINVWTFFASTERKSREIANVILSLEKLGDGETISCFEPGIGAWKAIKLKPEEIKRIQLAKDGEIINIKRKRASIIDAIYMTRLQKERE